MESAPDITTHTYGGADESASADSGLGPASQPGVALLGSLDVPGWKKKKDGMAV